MNSLVTMHIAKRDSRSYLAGNYYTPPFKLADITEDRRDPYLHLMLMCSSPGVLDGDHQTIRITLEPDSRLYLHTQSYQRLFRMKTGASLNMEVHIDRKAAFCFLPHPTVPHATSVFTGRNRIFLGPRARLLWGEVVTCGRKLTGEVFAFTSYRMRTEVYIADRLALLENVSLQPAVLPVNTLGQLAGFTHQASLLYIQEGRRTPEDIPVQIAAFLASRQSIAYGITEGPANSVVVRMLGHAAEELYDHLRTIQNIIDAC